jgi:hypothetical protein
MNPTSNSESYPPSFIAAYVDSRGKNILTASSQSNLQDALPLPQTVHDTSASNTEIQYQQLQTSVTSSCENPILLVHPTAFFFRPPNDSCHYYIDCKEIPYNTVGYLLNESLKRGDIQSNKKECIFYHQQQCNDRLYQVSCEIASPFLINGCLNKYLLGIELQQQNIGQDNLEFTFDQRENLKTHLLQYLNNYLLN